MTTEKSNTSHCTADAETQSFVCKHCGATQPFPELPLELLKFTRISRKFLNKHQNCKAK